MNNNVIILENFNVHFFGLYSLGPIELEIFKTYIKINLDNNFIYFFKFFAKTLFF